VGVRLDLADRVYVREKKLHHPHGGAREFPQDEPIRPKYLAP
jgi:hypothetical protein